MPNSQKASTAFFYVLVMTEAEQAVRTKWHMPKETEATPAVFASSIVWGRARWVERGDYGEELA